MYIKNSKQDICESLRRYANCIENGTLNVSCYVDEHVTEEKSRISFYVEDPVSNNDMCRAIAEQMGSPY